MDRRFFLKSFAAASALVALPSCAIAHHGADAKADFSAAGDGTTDDRDAIENWFQAGGSQRLLLPAGHYRCEIGVGEAFTALPAGTMIEGEGKSVSILEFVFDSSDTNYFAMISLLNGSITFRDLTLRFTTSSGNKVMAFALKGPNVTFERVTFDGNVTYSSGVPSAELILFNLGTGTTCEDFSFYKCKVSGFAYTWLKSNTSTAINRRWRISHSRFENNGSSVNLNSPVGVFEDVWIEKNEFGDHYGKGSDCFPIALASIKNFQVNGNVFTGRVDLDCIHIEEGSGPGGVAGNILDYSSNSAVSYQNNGIFIVENNIGGVMLSPSDILIHDNIIRRTGTGIKGTGIHMVYNGSSTPPAKRVSVHDNYIENFSIGIQGGDGENDVSIRDNHVRACTTGISVYKASPRFTGNLLEGCTTNLQTVAGGTWGTNIFKP